MGWGKVPERGWGGGGGGSKSNTSDVEERKDAGGGGGGGIAGYRVQTHNLFTPSFVSRTTEKDHLCGNNLTKRLSAPERQICTDIVIITSIKLLAVCETTC